MTVEVYAGPGVEDYRSPTYSATVFGSEGDGGAAYVYFMSRTSTVKTLFYDTGDELEVSTFTYGTDEAAVCTVSMVSGSVTSVELFPKNQSIPHDIVGGELVIQAPARSKMLVIINDDWRHPLVIKADTLKPTVDDAAVTMTDAEEVPEVPENGYVYVAPGSVIDIGRLYKINSGGTLYIDGGAVLLGSLDIRGSNNIRITGPGILWNNYATCEEVQLVSGFFNQIEYALICGYDQTPGADNYHYTNNRLERITLMGSPFYGSYFGINSASDVSVISPWCPNSDPLVLSRDVNEGNLVVIDHCITFVGDDNLKAVDSAAKYDYGDNFLINTSSASIHLAYQAQPYYGVVETTINNTTVVNINDADGTEGETSTIIKCWSDCTDAQSASGYGRYNVTISGVYVEGSGGNGCELFSIQNKLYPWGTSYDAAGNIAQWTISDVSVETAPTLRSELKGRDSNNTPHDIHFRRITIGGTLLTANNWTTYVDANQDPYDIHIGSRTMTADATSLWAAVVLSYDSSGLVSLTNVRTRSANVINTDAGEDAAQGVIDLWPLYAQCVYDSTNSIHVEVAKLAVIALLWRRGGTAQTIAQVQWDEVFSDDGLLAKVRRTGARGRTAPRSNSGVSASTDLLSNGRQTRPWSDRDALPTNFLPRRRPADD